jgi:glycerophosphoryl diester phosphodiesterase
MKLRLLSNLLGLLTIALVVSLSLVVSPDATEDVEHASTTSISAMRRACTNVQAAGHRGLGPNTRWVAGSKYTEDTIKSANGAYRYGADVSKADLHMSAERTWFILHDSDLTRVTNGRDRRKLRSMTDAQIREVVLPDGSHIPSLEDYLTNLRYGSGGRYASRMAQLEVKRQAHTRADMQRVTDMIRAYGLQGQVLLISSTLSMLKEMASLAPEIRRTYVWYSNGSRPAISQMPRYVQMINVNQSQASARYVRKAHSRGFKVAARSANTSQQWNRLLQRRAASRPDQISTDNMHRFYKWCNNR